MKLYISKTYPIKGAPVYRAYEVKNGLVIPHDKDTSVSHLVETLETINPKPVIYFDDDARLDFFREPHPARQVDGLETEQKK